MDPFTALGIASSIVQLVDFSVKVAQRLNDFHHRTGDIPKVFRGISLRLPILIDGLTRTSAAIKSGSSVVNAETCQALSQLISSCLVQTNALDDILTQTLPQKDDSWVQRNKKALQSLTKDKIVEQIEAELNNCIGLLTFHHVTPTTSSSNQSSPVSASPSSPENKPIFYEVPRRQVSKFIGREAILSEMEEKFERSSTVILQGMGGQGKTQLAIEYCQRSRENSCYKGIFWVDSSSEPALKRSFEVIAEVLTDHRGGFKSVDERIAYVKTTLSSWTHPWLLVFDNYDDPILFPNALDFMPPSNYGRVLLTSRHADVSRYGALIHISRMLESEALELLFSRTMVEKTPSNTRYAVQIAERLGFHPLALEQAAAYIRKRSGSLLLSEFLGHYQRRKKDILQQIPKVWEYRKRFGDSNIEKSLSVFTTLELSYEQLGHDQTTTSGLQSLFSLCAYFYHDDVGESLFRIYQKRTQDLLPIPAWIEVCLADGTWSPDSFEDAIIELHDLALIEGYYKDRNSSLHFSIHPLVKDWIRLRVDGDISQQQSLLATSILEEYIAESFREDNGTLCISPKETQMSLLHITTIEGNHAEFFAPPSKYRFAKTELVQLREAYVLFADFLLYFHRHAEAHALLRRVLETWRGISAQKTPLFLI